ncbi:hypothetical protein ISN45_Aa06g009510 [Arabidopsis thaliana x Arabidopsis arenosa]|uniref:Uncharacterized protein n=1 Tax=Arabidopsis thaliana x Arabidopsis arenosa TaxID=1240361 RepID=A0A8T1YUH9_9BRAS|nr:hypothetical protein ISN45_Aa08g020940 [Arabidopsis thaliana x Arabidopsis arenosa]KAG7550137.1 hypothetical protein ISN45_Aa06g009510 [Arabidopsis thaliana x Arabidopsis arenosa]
MEVVERTTEMAEERCTTPRNMMYKISVASVCLPPSRKKSMVVRKRDPPRNGYFQPPDWKLCSTHNHRICNLLK